MFAAIISSDGLKGKTKITENRLGAAGVVTVGCKVSQRRLKKALQKYNGEIIFAKNVDTRGILPFDTLCFKKYLLFEEFSDYVLSENCYNLKIGIMDSSAQFLIGERIPCLIAHAGETVICTKENIDELCRFWLKSTGVCPEVTDNPLYLSDCDICFAPNGMATSGILFGSGGRGINIKSTVAKIPKEYHFLLAHGINPAELLCMLENEKKYCIT